jgi:hypothetical protein
MRRFRTLQRHRAAISFLVVCLLSSICCAHVGSPDVYFQGAVGPFHLAVLVRTPTMIPGVAQIEVRCDKPGIRHIKLTPLFIVGDGSKYPPPPDIVSATPGDPQFFAGKIWLMESGSWQVRIEADDSSGGNIGTLSVPVPAFARSTLPMQRTLGITLFALMTLIVAALVAILGAARRESTLPPGDAAGPKDKRAARLVMAIVFVLVVGILALGRMWWTSSAKENSLRMIYRAPQIHASLVSGDSLLLRMDESTWHKNRPETVMTSLIADHGHLMHLFLVRTPEMDRFYHLHPTQADDESFTANLPPVAAGHYKVFADIVRSSGFPDTMVAEIDLPDVAGTALSGDDSEASATRLASSPQVNAISPLADGSRMVWLRDSSPLVSNRLEWFRFRVEDDAGKPVVDLEPYMGMAGHAEFLRSDLSVFAHVHPDGSVPVAALLLANASLPNSAPVHPAVAGTNATPSVSDMSGMNMSSTNMPAVNTPAQITEVSFPYGFPKPGLYRIFVQIKRQGSVQTGVFDVTVN